MQHKWCWFVEMVKSISPEMDADAGCRSERQCADWTVSLHLFIVMNSAQFYEFSVWKTLMVCYLIGYVKCIFVNNFDKLFL